MCAAFTVDPRIDHQRSEILLKPLSSLNLIHSKQHISVQKCKIGSQKKPCFFPRECWVNISRRGSAGIVWQNLSVLLRQRVQTQVQKTAKLAEAQNESALFVSGLLNLSAATERENHSCNSPPHQSANTSQSYFRQQSRLVFRRQGLTGQRRNERGRECKGNRLP